MGVRMTEFIPHFRNKISVFLLLFLIFAVSLSLPINAQSKDEGKIVRVGWYDSSYNQLDPVGRRSGYAYEYQLKISAYTGWTYEYVKGSWSVLLQMLQDGDIDLMSDVSYTEKRAENMFYPSLPMGTEEYYLFIAPDNREISQADYSTLNGKKVGVNKDSIQADFYREWAEKHDVKAEVIEVTFSEDESLRRLVNGDLDAYVTVDSFVHPELAIPVCKVGSSEFYFAVSKSRPDLLKELNEALNRIQDENRYYNQQMFEKYIKRAGANAFLTLEEVDWLNTHDKIRVGYLDNYLAFSGTDKSTGELTGALKNYLAYASDSMVNVRLDFDPIAYPTASEAIKALQNGEIDCMFPSSLSVYDGEMLNVTLTSPLMSTEVYAIIRQADQNLFVKKDHVIVAVNEGNPNYDSFLLTHYPDWRTVYYPTTLDCLKAVSDGVADCVLISNFRYNNLSRLSKKYHLIPLTTGKGLGFSFAVKNGETALYSILTKAIGRIPDSIANAALSYYITEDARLSLSDFITDNIVIVSAVVFVVLLIIIILLIQSMRSERKARKLISATETDDLTGLYNRSFFFQYANRIYREHPDTPMDAIVLNIEQFHTVNALYGRDFGDQVLRTLGKEIQAVAKEAGGIAGRFEADRFDIYCPHTDMYQAIYDRLQKKLEESAPNTSIRLRMGVMPWQEKIEPWQLFDRARIACTMARGHYKEHLIIFDEKIRDREIFEQRLLNDLRRALDSYEFEVFYQPKYNIQTMPPKLVSAEALVRWRHPELGMISPDDFIPLFEKNGRISMVDKYVWEEAAKQIARWKEQYGITIPVSVNLSRLDVFNPMLENTLDEILIYNDLDYNDIKLEVTESAYTENADHVIRVVENLRKKGYIVEMDDFGTGYSSLNMLSSMPIDVLKMDRAFVRNIEHSEKDIQLVGLILDIAKNMNIPVIAEGVETEEQIRLLKDLGCALVQGYYFSKPLHASDFERKFLSNRDSDQ